MLRFLVLVVLVFASIATSFPSYGTLAGFSELEQEAIISTLHIRGAEPPPGPIPYTGTKLVNDKDHPYEDLRPGDIRGPCPGLNTLASHGYLPRNGIATPAQIITAVQEGFNMGYDLAVFVTYAAFLVDGNPITNLMSIGGKSPLTGPDPPKPAIVGGLDTHGVFEGDASMTRGDVYFGDNHSFNETLFEQFSKISAQFGGGKYNMNAAAELRYKLIKESIATNPEFSFISPRYFTAYAESILPMVFFVDGRISNLELNMADARGFFQNMKMPDGFFRARRPYDINDIGAGMDILYDAHPIQPGANHGVNNYVLDPNSANLAEFCKLYTDYLNITVRGLYPNPTGVLLKALNDNLDNLYSVLPDQGCTQFFPYGK